MSSKAEPRTTFSSAAATPSIHTPNKPKLSSSELITMIRSGERKDEDFPPLFSKPSISTTEEDFGMKSLLESIKQLPADKNIMALGVEVESLGLPLETNALLVDADFPLYNEIDVNLCEELEPKWQRKLPTCYNVQAPPPPIEKIHAFSDETLFYIFYSRKADAKLQEQASFILMLRGWRYWRQEEAWIMRDRHPIAPDVYIKFDANLWMPLRHRIPDLKDSMLDPLPQDPKFPSRVSLGYHVRDGGVPTRVG